jgi:hypothetical protein
MKDPTVDDYLAPVAKGEGKQGFDLKPSFEADRMRMLIASDPLLTDKFSQLSHTTTEDKALREIFDVYVVPDDSMVFLYDNVM